METCEGKGVKVGVVDFRTGAVDFLSPLDL